MSIINHYFACEERAYEFAARVGDTALSTGGCVEYARASLRHASSTPRRRRIQPLHTFTKPTYLHPISCHPDRKIRDSRLSIKAIRPRQTHHDGHVTPGLEIRAHYTPIEKQVDDEEQAGQQEDRCELVVIHEAGQPADVHDHVVDRQIPDGDQGENAQKEGER